MNASQDKIAKLGDSLEKQQHQNSFSENKALISGQESAPRGQDRSRKRSPNREKKSKDRDKSTKDDERRKRDKKQQRRTQSKQAKDIDESHREILNDTSGKLEQTQEIALPETSPQREEQASDT